MRSRLSALTHARLGRQGPRFEFHFISFRGLSHPRTPALLQGIGRGAAYNMAEKALATVEELPNEVLLRCLSFLSANELLICQVRMAPHSL